MRLRFAVLGLFASICFCATGQCQPPADKIAKLEKEFAALQTELAALKKDLASLKVAASRINLAFRADAAAAISNSSEREAAYARLAVDAAQQGDGKTAKKAVESIGNSTTREDTAYKAAVALGFHPSEGEMAVALAKSLSNSSQREKALLKIAKGERTE